MSPIMMKVEKKIIEMAVRPRKIFASAGKALAKSEEIEAASHFHPKEKIGLEYEQGMNAKIACNAPNCTSDGDTKGGHDPCHAPLHGSCARDKNKV
ncbi:metalloproteinase inhibitor 3 [Lasius niger]|uniref:Metalloproteinase inhibitor 3 n=1 Tax=Lasius niger TaxID=67767 RepID=A0A0J7K5K4_LASNI|nr:metalloproteinase inhibitor 3 [Lasius niger]